VPQVVGALAYGAYQIGLGDRPSPFTNKRLRPPRHPILKVKGFNKEFPEVYGFPETVKGKTVLVTHGIIGPLCHEHLAESPGSEDSDVVVKRWTRRRPCGL